MAAVFFDLDGTLLDSRADLAAAVNATRRTLGYAPLAEADVLVHVGSGARHLLEHAIPEAAHRHDEVWPIFAEAYRTHMFDRSVLYPGVRETLARLADAGWRLGINTNKPAFATRAVLAHFGLAPFFGEAVVAGGDCAEMKPAAEPLVRLAARMGYPLAPDDWMVGDHWTDLACAAAAGVRSVYCAYGFGRLLPDSRHTAKIDAFSSLPDVLAP